MTADRIEPSPDGGEAFRDLPPVKRSAVAHFRALWPVLRPLRASLSAIAALTALGGLAEAAVLVVVADLAVTITGDGSGGTLDLGPLTIELGDEVPRLFVVAVTCVVIRLGTQLMAMALSARALARMQLDLRSRAFSAFVAADWSTQAAEPDGYLQELVTIYIARTTSSIQIITGAIAAAFNFAAMMAAALLLAPATALIILACVGVLFLLFRPFSVWVRSLSAQRAEEGREFARVVTESVTHSMEIRTTNVTDSVVDDIRARAERLRALELRTELVNLSLSPLYQGVGVLALLAALAVLYATGSPQAATLGAVLLLLLRAVSYSQSMQTAFHRLNDLAPYAERLASELDRYTTAAAPDGDIEADRLRSLTFESVTHSYGRGDPALQEVDLEIEQGEILGLIGASGAGKTTFVQILLGLTRPTSGSLLANGRPPDVYQATSWYRRVAFVPQEPRLIVGTVADNIRYWRSIDEGRLVDAARRAHVHDDVMSWPDGYDTPVGPRGSTVSGGQRQRLAIARALAGDPDLLVLDEPTSALDLRSEAMIERALVDLKGTVTMVIITHRLSTIAACDRLLVLQNGRVEALGSPEEVKLTSSFYRDAVDRTTVGPDEDGPSGPPAGKP